MHKKILAAVFLVVLVYISAANAMPPSFLLGDCAESAEKYCEDQDGEDFKLCMGNHFLDAAPGCQKDMLVRAEESGGCSYDRLKYCAALQTGTGAQFQGKLEVCFRDNWDKLKESCRAKINKMKPCEEDVKKYCYQITVGSGKLMECLRDVKDQLGAQCTSSLGSDLEEPSWYEIVLSWFE